ncbi:hypothetical protein BGX38DRAFT_1138959 [Terfezia claveryi]|nr:hypothetical protein BGX38DRAFT_1138959 [Terfezia claveryi]
MARTRDLEILLVQADCSTWRDEGGGKSGRRVQSTDIQRQRTNGKALGTWVQQTRRDGALACLEEVKEEIYFNLPVLLTLVSSEPVYPSLLVDEVVENSVEEEEQCILDTYERAPLHESDSDADGTPDGPLSHIQLRLREGLEALRLFRLQNQNAHVNSQKSEELEALLYRGKRDIECLQGMRETENSKRRSLIFWGPRSGIS